MRYLLMNLYPDDFKHINGVLFYMLEMCQFLKDKHNIKNIYELFLGSENTRNMVNSRYKYTFPSISLAEAKKDECIIFISANALFGSLTKNEFAEFYKNKNVKFIYILNADGVDVLFKRAIMKCPMILVHYNELKSKLFLLSEIGFENPFNKMSKLPIISIIRGVYFDNFKTISSNNNVFFFHDIKHPSINVYDQNTYDRAIRYINDHGLNFERSGSSLNPSSEYKGLIYFRFHDYMPRLPYEFWYYDKEVVLIEVSDGLKKRMDIYGKKTFEWNLDLLMKENF